MLGPLCIGFALMRVPAGMADIWAALSPTVSKSPKDRSKRIVVCDSKQLHSPSRGVLPLEESLLPCAMAAKSFPESGCSLADFFAGFASLPTGALSPHPWYREPELSLPAVAQADRLSLRLGLLRQALAKSGVELLSVGCLPVVESEFNRLYHEHQNKSDLNLSAFCSVIRRFWAKHPRLIAVLDRLGGRQFYRDALMRHLSPKSVTVNFESIDSSHYVASGEASGAIEPRLEIRIEVGADLMHFPVALASMAAKYTREVSMEAFNRWFGAHQPDLKPTKGYVTDARRWLVDSQSLRKRLRIPEDLLIRRA